MSAAGFLMGLWRFRYAIGGALGELVQKLYEATKGDPEEASRRIRRVLDQGNILVSAEEDARRRIQAAREQQGGDG